MPRSLVFIFLFIFLNVGATQSPQEQHLLENIEQRKFDNKKYENLTKDIDYSEEEYKPKERKEKDTSPILFEGLGPLLKFIFIALGIALLVFILIQALGNKKLLLPKDKKIKATAQIDLEKIEEDLENAELRDPIQQAIATGDYPLAIRLYYLAILQELHLEKKIKWKKEKTNGEYLRELAGQAIFKDMQNITLIFERTFYGKLEIDKNTFLKIEPIFLKMLKTRTVSV